MLENFRIQELVCQHVYAKYGDNSMRFLDHLTLCALHVIRVDILGVPLVINNGSTLTQRGLRCNLCELVKSKETLYLSGHQFGKGFDFSSTKMSPNDMRAKIIEKQHLLPCKIRLEHEDNASTWVHFDTMTFDQEEKIYIFRA